MTHQTTDALQPLDLKSRYTATTGTIYLNGLQAMLRILLEQSRVDRAAGLNTGGLLCGYPGSPLGGVDGEFIKHRTLFEAEGVHHQLGLNEELAATAIYGTQLVHDVPGAAVDGVFGMWFGKAPGVDRAADAFHHANFHGIARNGGVLAVAGDDPHARSTILPSDSNTIFASFYMPVLAPGDVQEVIDLGRHGYALSRAAGLWVGFKLISDVADSSGTVEVGADRVVPIMPEVMYEGAPLRPAFRPNEAGPPMIAREHEIYYGRLEIARRYARLNRLNRITKDAPGARLGIVAGGKTYFDLCEALHALGLDDAALAERGIRLLKMGMLYPFDTETALEFADGLDEILVVEDKRPFLETAFKDTLYGRPDAPRIVGKNDSKGSLLLTACGELSSDVILAGLRQWLDMPAPAPAPLAAFAPLGESRSPYFCSGCPHNRSLRAPDGAVVGAGIGCHIMTLWMGPIMGEVTSYTQMGGEGAQWVGLRRFTTTPHFFQNLGDGTHSHSGSLAIRFAVAAGANITYKLLYNSAVAMTGGQEVFGGKTVPDLVREMAAEGVKRVTVVTDEPERYRGVTLDPIATLRHRDDLLDVERELAAVTGVTVLLNDQQCAAEKRRDRKRGTMATPARRVAINDRICEGCGDCGVKSNCLSVEPVATPFGRKTRINQTSCNQDYSCLLGDCPSFMTIEGAPPPRRRAAPTEPPAALVEPTPAVPTDEFGVFLAGIGGTGVVTVNQILGMAGALAGYSVKAVDQTGSSQKAGPVTSHLRIARRHRDGGSRIMAGGADTLMCFDSLTAAEIVNLAIASRERTVLVANIDAVPTGGTVTDVTREYPQAGALLTRLGTVTRPGGHAIAALSLSRHLFGNEVAANLIIVGAAYQAGALPLPLAAIEQAIRLNGVAVEANLLALRWGRYAVQDPAAIAAMMAPPATPTAVRDLPAALAEQVTALALASDDDAAVRLRVAELIAFQNATLANNYLSALAEVRATATTRLGQAEALTPAVATNLHKLMAYKDEYEVARLMVEAWDRQRAAGEIGSAQRVRWLVHPTFLRSLGVRKKVALGRWFIPVARVLMRMKGLRGSALDLLGRTHVRQVERNLIDDYRAMLAAVLPRLTQANAADILALAQLPDIVRGYEDVKLRNVKRMETRRAALLAQLDRPVPVQDEAESPAPVMA